MNVRKVLEKEQGNFRGIDVYRASQRTMTLCSYSDWTKGEFIDSLEADLDMSMLDYLEATVYDYGIFDENEYDPNITFEELGYDTLPEIHRRSS